LRVPICVGGLLSPTEASDAMFDTLLRFRRLFVLLILSFACGFAAREVHAESRTMKIVVPLAAGGGADILARELGEQIGHARNATVIVENRPGAGTAIGTEAVARSTPDGTTVLLTNPAFVINPHLRAVNYDPLTGFEPVCNIVDFPLVYVVPATSAIKTLADLLNLARAKPGAVTVSSAGIGTPTHIGFEVLKRLTGLQMTYVPYSGAAPAVSALLGGHITAVFSDYTTVSAQLKSGALRALAIGSKTRFQGLPDVPTVAESGYEDYEAGSWNGVLAPAKTPDGVLAELVTWFRAAGESSQVKDKLAAQGLYPSVVCGADFGVSLRLQYERYGKAIRDANLKVQ
jgi:tripartite-type tricarboxylate transporter receptor subunit TctC